MWRVSIFFIICSIVAFMVGVFVGSATDALKYSFSFLGAALIVMLLDLMVNW